MKCALFGMLATVGSIDQVPSSGIRRLCSMLLAPFSGTPGIPALAVASPGQSVHSRLASIAGGLVPEPSNALWRTECAALYPANR
jgi:hypothetical protein